MYATHTHMHTYTHSACSVNLLALPLNSQLCLVCVYLLVTDLMRDFLRGMFCVWCVWWTWGQVGMRLRGCVCNMIPLVYSLFECPHIVYVWMACWTHSKAAFSSHGPPLKIKLWRPKVTPAPSFQKQIQHFQTFQNRSITVTAKLGCTCSQRPNITSY